MNGELLLAARKSPDKRLTINELNGHAPRKLSRWFREFTGCDEHAAGGADFVHGSGKLTNTWDADVKDKPMFALHENRRLLAKQDKIVATVRTTMCRLLDEITLFSIDPRDEVLEGLPAESSDALQKGEFRGRKKNEIVWALRSVHWLGLRQPWWQPPAG